MFEQGTAEHGYHEVEQDALGPFQWTRGAFVLQPAQPARFARLRLCYLGAEGTLRFQVGGELLDEAKLRFGWHDYVVKMAPSEGAPIAVTVSPVTPVDGDTRELGVMLRDVSLFDHQPLLIPDDGQAQDGYFPVENDVEGELRWTHATFVLRPVHAARFAQMRLCYLGEAGRLTFESGGKLLDEVELHFGWHNYVVSLAPSAGAPVFATVSPLVAVSGDSRELGVMLRRVILFDDEQLFNILCSASSNARLNEEEFQTGCTVLASYPPALRISMETRCNIPETGQACAYCCWDWTKAMERGAPAFRLDTLNNMGDFYRCATNVHDYSIAEPTMHKQFGQIVAKIDADQKSFSMTTNGQLMVERRRRDLLGKNVVLYVSIEAATAAGYARYRNNRFDDLIANLRALCREKRQHGNLPTVFISAVAMRSNRDEWPQFFELMAEVGVDQIKLRSLNLDDNANAPVIENNGYRFDYAAEVLSMAELEELTPALRNAAAAHNIPVYLEWDEFAAEVSSTEPLCPEPWKTLWVLHRGIVPCCYATEPLARWDEQGDRSLEQFLGDVFNGPEYQHIRAELAAGRLSSYCRNTPSCPVLKRLAHTGEVPGLEEPTYSPRSLSPGSTPLIPIESLTLLSRRGAPALC